MRKGLLFSVIICLSVIVSCGEALESEINSLSSVKTHLNTIDDFNGEIIFGDDENNVLNEDIIYEGELAGIGYSGGVPTETSALRKHDDDDTELKEQFKSSINNLRNNIDIIKKRGGYVTLKGRHFSEYQGYRSLLFGLVSKLQDEEIDINIEVGSNEFLILTKESCNTLEDANVRLFFTVSNPYSSLGESEAAIIFDQACQNIIHIETQGFHCIYKYWMYNPYDSSTTVFGNNLAENGISTIYYD